MRRSRPSGKRSAFVRGFFGLVGDELPEVGGEPTSTVPQSAKPSLSGHFGGCVSGLEMPFPGNRDRLMQRRGLNARLSGRQAEHLVLAGPSAGLPRAAPN